MRVEGQEIIHIECDEPQHAVAPGQVAVLWLNNICLGNGVIEAAR